MITPNIAPTKVLNPLSRGLFTAAKNSVSRIKNTTENISKAASESRSKAVSDKNQKFAMNFLEFFGSKKTAKILKKSLESIKKSIVSTLEIAKVLRASLGDITKVAKKSGCDLSVLLENASNLNIDNYKNHQTIGLSSGASVPDILVQDVISKFREAFEINVKEVGAGEENISFKLPRGI